MINRNTRDTLLWIIGIGFLFPLFFQISGRIYRSVHPVIDSGGVISRLPLPVSVIVCCIGLLIFVPNLKRALTALTIVAAMVLVLGISLVLAGPKIELRKVVMILQVLLPMAGLVLGQLIEDENKIIPKAFLGVLLVTVPAQLLAGWVQGTFGLTHDLYIFSVYQHFQFVPVIFVCAFAYSISILWDTHKKTFILLAMLMCLYTYASLSMLTIFAFTLFIASFSFVRLSGLKKLLAFLWFPILFMGFQSYFFIVGNYIMKDNPSNYLGTGQYESKFKSLAEGRTPDNAEERFGDWKLYGNGIAESAKTIFVGHPAPLPREVKTSAHNWYVDLTYNFGLISLLPVLLLLIYTLFLLWRGIGKWPPETVWLAVIVFYLVAIDSNFKVTLRQPYPGIFAYFMWGTLLSALKRNPARGEY